MILWYTAADLNWAPFEIRGGVKHASLQLLPLLHLGLEALGLGRHLKAPQHRALHHQLRPLDQGCLEALLLLLVLLIPLGALILEKHFGHLLCQVL